MNNPAVTRPPHKSRFLVSLYHTPSDLARDAFYTSVRAGHLVAGPEHRIERECYPGHELILCLRGRGHARVQGRAGGVSAGQLVWVNCHHPHTYWADATSPWEVYWVRIDGPRLDRVEQILFGGSFPVMNVSLKAVATVFRRIFQHMESLKPDAEARLHAELARLVALLVQQRIASDPDGVPTPSIPELLRRPLERMRLYYHLPLRVGELAKLAGMSPSHFARTFKHVMGTSPINWLRRERINQAKRRLTETTDAVKEIAQQCGYSDAFYFSRDFKQFTRCAPTEYRRRERGGAE
ncbi:MAG: AraC family transcriptional regulator [Limisphaerales bacterium]